MEREFDREKYSFQRMPDFIMIGAMRSGTTYLFEMLKRHPQIIGATKKEVHYFDENYGKGREWYLSFFPVPKEMIERKEKFLVGEATPKYLPHPRALLRIKEDIPEVKLIVAFRNPVYRALSHHKLMTEKGVEKRPLKEAIEEDIRLIETAEWTEILKMKPDHWGSAWLSYVARGIYVFQIARWMTVFAREQFLIIKAEEMFDDYRPVYERIIDFLGLDQGGPSEFHKLKNVSHQPGNEEVIRRLRDFFLPYNEKLYEYLGKDFGWEAELAHI